MVLVPNLHISETQMLPKKFCEIHCVFFILFIDQSLLPPTDPPPTLMVKPLPMVEREVNQRIQKRVVEKSQRKNS